MEPTASATHPDPPTRRSASAEPHRSAATAPQVEIVVPVHNEQRALAASVRRLHDYLSSELRFSWRIVIADNASTDETPAIAAALAADLPGVSWHRTRQKGRGRALRETWSASDAGVLAYMDVDLSTDLRALLPLLAPLVNGHSDLAIGTRLAAGAQVVRGLKRELISRSYNQLLRWTLGARFSDAQCGFKAIRSDAARALLPTVRDQAWFFDTELLIGAQRHGLRIHEVAVDWVDDPDSSVALVRTAWDDLRGVGRLLAVSAPARFVAIGIVSTLAFALLFLGLRSPLGAAGANAAALAITAVANTQANRHFTFGIRGRQLLVRQHVMGALVLVLALALTNGALAVLHGLDATPSRLLELSVLVVASACATVTRYVGLKTWVFARAHRARPGPRSAAFGRAEH